MWSDGRKIRELIEDEVFLLEGEISTGTGLLLKAQTKHNPGFCRTGSN